MITTTDGGTLFGIAAMLLAAGLATGILAGLFGVGGGAILVPVMFLSFTLVGVEEAVAMPLAVGTSLAVIVPTSISSARGHYAKGTVDMTLVRIWAIPILIGVLGGAALARLAEPWVFQLVFILVASTNAAKLLFGKANWKVGDELPTGWLLRLYGLLAGLLSALMGIGGGAITNLAMTLHGRPIHQAVATSAAIGVVISIPGSIGYVLAGIGKTGLPPGSLGFVSLLGCMLIVPTTLLTTKIGVRMAHAMSRRTLEKAFGGFLIAVCLRFLHLLVT
ncbi:MAG: sulfite exporter TauE/SafE family protein [Alphaproteobacteria bacterium]|jgi:uncharacterized membrane protein YfcA|nr:sulfite exporter TauE/SafE family protein [Alphaproteobacteria bacterium]